MRRRTWIGTLAAMLVAASCYTDGRGVAPGDGGDAAVRLRIGGDAAALGAGGGGGLTPLGFVPEEVDAVDLRVTGAGMADFAQRYTIPADRDLVIAATFPSGPARRFEVDALRVGEVEVVLYQGAAVQDLAPGPNDVVVQMEGRGTVDGTIQYLLGDAPFTLIDPATTPVAGETVTFTNLATDYQAEAVTDGAGGFVSPPLPLGAYQADVAPGECLYAGWDGCLSFTRFDLSAPGERQTTMMAVVPPVGTLGWMPWATSVTPSIGQRGVDAVTVFGRDFAPDPGGGGVALIYFSVANDDPGGAFDPVNSTADEITGAIPAAYDQAAGYVFGEGWGLDRSYSNPLPFTILP